MSDDRPAAVRPFLATRESAPSFWQIDALWTVLASANATGGSFTALEQLMPRYSGPPPHVHPRWHEFFYLLEGDIRFQVDDEVLEARGGGFLSIPPATPHAFVVTSETARVLNMYTPGGFDEQVTYTGTPAASLTLPPEGTPERGSAEQHEAFTRRAVELNSQAPTPGVADLLADLRPPRSGA